MSMWLINTETLRLHSKDEIVRTGRGSSRPSYAILSHRWETEEVSFQQIREGSPNSVTSLKGWVKIRNFCLLARSRSLDWAWVDTCCIDKSSSAELSEAINSMFRWYEDAELCCIFLSDVSDPKDMRQFSRSDWFTRGWTLQELIAPRKHVEFYSQTWSFIGTRTDLCAAISTRTRIPVVVFDYPVGYPISKYSVAQKMSWASRRRTTRGEDIAYCLLGIFCVNLPLLYGEGASNAFRRLQLEIINSFNDETIFAWRSISGANLDPVLGRGPFDFDQCGNVTCGAPRLTPRVYTMTNRGLQLQARLYYHQPQGDILPLNCNQDGKPLGLQLKKLSRVEVYSRLDLIEIPKPDSEAYEKLAQHKTREIIVHADYRNAASRDSIVDQPGESTESMESLERDLKAKLSVYIPTNNFSNPLDLRILGFNNIVKSKFDKLEFVIANVSVPVSYPEFCIMLRKSGLHTEWVESFIEALERVKSGLDESTPDS